MLTQLTISNFAIIDHLEINFKEGLVALVGETGAGKSIIVDALDFLLGARASIDLIKTGKEKAKVEGTFLLSNKLKLYLEENSFESLDNQLIITREITSQGSKVRINGSIASISFLSSVREYLIDIHAQNDQIGLLKPEKQLEVLDGFGSESHKKIIEQYRKTFTEYQTLKTKLSDFKENSELIVKNIDFLKFQINEIRAASIQDINEESGLMTKREILLNKKSLNENTNLIYDFINSETGLLNNLGQIKKLILKSSEHDKSFKLYLEIIENLFVQIKELSSFVGSYSESIDQGNDNLKEIEERLDLFYSLKRKYGKSLSEIKNYYEKIQSELSLFESQEISINELEKLFKRKENEVNNLADILSRSREKLTRNFVDKVNEELSTLGFKQALFVVEFISCDLMQCGKEQIQFLFTANADEPPKLLLKVVSGGELSRIMLAIKSIAERNLIKQAPTMIFDEIDIGVSGEIAASVARKLYKISRFNQALCITHNPIIAAMADEHFIVEKTLKNGQTQIAIKVVTTNEKAEALASLLTPEGKESLKEDAREFAESLLENARRIKEKDYISL